MVNWAGQIDRWQTNDRGHNGSGETWGSAIVLLPRECLSSGGDCELANITRCCVAWGKFELLSSHPAHFPSPPEEGFTIRLSAEPYSMQAKLGPQAYLICIACNAMTELWFAVVSPPSQLARSLGEDTIWRFGKDTRHRRLRWHGHVERSHGGMKEFQKLNPTGGRGRGHPKKPWTEVIDMDCLALGLQPCHYTPRTTKLLGVYWFHSIRLSVRLSVCLSVRPSVPPAVSAL